MIRGVAWDIDGTLIDSEPNHHAALIEVSKRYGLAVARDDPRFIGVAMDRVWDELQPHYPESLTPEIWLDEIVMAYVASAAALTPLAGAREAVWALAQAGVRQSCVSNSVRRVVDANLTRLGLQDAFEFAIAREDVARGKPDPEPYALACQRFRLSPEEVVAIEDSEAGAASAHAAGLKVLRVDARGEVYAAVVALFGGNAKP